MGVMWRFLTRPMRIGAVCASSRVLCRQMIREIGLEQAKALAELGPGTGVITREILRAKPDGAQFFAVELDPGLYRQLCRSFPELTAFNANATELSRLREEVNAPKLDAVISGLPWAIFPASLQRALLGAILENLAEDGCFTTFAYLHGLMMPTGIRFRRLLQQYFEEITMSRVVWRNLPPAVVYRCRRKRAAAPEA